MFFTARDGKHGRELWTSDGTEAGTVLVKDIRPGAYGSNPAYLTAAAGELFFSAKDGVHGGELWKSDGTEAGTVLVKDVDAGTGDYSGPQSLTRVGDRLFFSIDDGAHGREPWISDGTAAGTTLIEDVNVLVGFTAAKSGRPDTSAGTVRVRVSTEGAGTLAVAPVGRSKVQSSTRTFEGAESGTFVLKPNRAGLRELRRTGSLEVKVRFTFTPCGSPPSSVVRSYTFKKE